MRVVTPQERRWSRDLAGRDRGDDLLPRLGRTSARIGVDSGQHVGIDLTGHDDVNAGALTSMGLRPDTRQAKRRRGSQRPNLSMMRGCRP